MSISIRIHQSVESYRFFNEDFNQLQLVENSWRSNMRINLREFIGNEDVMETPRAYFVNFAR